MEKRTYVFNCEQTGGNYRLYYGALVEVSLWAAQYASPAIKVNLLLK
jgi:hypothetical protein